MESAHTPAPRASASVVPESSASQTPATPTPVQTTAPAATKPPAPQTICGVYERPFSMPDDDATAVRLELFETGEGTLAFRMALVYPYGRTLYPVYILALEKDASGFRAVFDGEYEHVRLSGNGDEVTFRYEINGSLDPASGLYLPAAERTSELPEIPETQTDPLSPDGRIDRCLSDAARHVLGLDAEDVLTAEDCALITDLDLFETEITSLQGIEYFPNLKSFSVSGGYLRDISALSSLSSLEQISVSRCFVTEIPDFSACENLESLDISVCCVEDLSPVAKLSSLKRLNLCDNRITSVAPIRALPNLEYLDLSFNPVLDWDSVAENPALTASLSWDYGKVLAVQEKARKIVNETVRPGMTDLEKQIALCKKIHELADGEIVYRPQEPDGYEVIMHGKGVCGDFAQAVSLLMNMAGLHVINCGSDTHEWNMIELDGQWYEFDCFWDDETEIEDWSYFNLSHADMSAITHHQSNPLRYPLAEHSMMTLRFILS